MHEEEESYGHMYYFPPEILQNIFIYLPAKALTACRAVHPRWRDVVDSMSKDEEMWQRNCKDDYRRVYQIARYKARTGLSWYNLYRSLSIWKIVGRCKESNANFGSAKHTSQEIRNFKILRDGIVGVLKKGSIVYYDIETLGLAYREPITGDYSKYVETDNVIVILNYNLHLFIIRKVIMHSLGEEHTSTFNNVKLFCLEEPHLYFVNLHDEIFVCNLNERKFTATYLVKTDEGIMCLGYKDGFLNFLTYQRQIYSVVNKEYILRGNLGQDNFLLRQLEQYNLLENFDWRLHFQWMYVLNHSVPAGPLRDIVIVRPYGNIYFVGSNWGVLRIYYVPRDEVFDIFQTKPVKQYNFMERYHAPVLCVCPILQVDVVEGHDEHTVIVAMPKKVAMLNYSHNFEYEVSAPRVMELVPEAQAQPETSATPAKA